MDTEEERAKEKGIGWKTVTRSLSDYSLVQDACWYFVTYLCFSLLDYRVRTARSEGHTRFFPFVRSFVPSKKEVGAMLLSFSLSFCASILTLASNTFILPSKGGGGGRNNAVIRTESGER